MIMGMRILFSTGLFKRIKTLEKTLKVEDHVFYFEDGTHLKITALQFKRLWEDIHAVRHNSIYEHMKEKLNQGYPDDSGLIYLMQAEDPSSFPDLWDDEKCLN